MSAKLQTSWSHDPIDDKKTRLDGSYIASSFGSNNWMVGYGAIDRWWGPGWQESLILGHNARPMVGFFLQRNSLKSSQSRLLSWLGPWQLSLLATNFEEDRHISHARMLGARLAFKPMTGLELGLSRTAQWGGEGRPEDLDTFINLIIGNDNQRSANGDFDEETADEPGNQLAGVDATFSFNFLDTFNSVYFQVIGEDEARGLPSRALYQMGSSSSFSFRSTDHMIALEYSNTVAGLGDRLFDNYAYEHGIYLSGYRYYGRSLGASTDNDSQAFSLLGQHWFHRGYQVNWKLMKADINSDGSNRREQFGGGNMFGSEFIEQFSATLSIHKSLNPFLSIGVGAYYFHEDMLLQKHEINNGGFLSFEYTP